MTVTPSPERARPHGSAGHDDALAALAVPAGFALIDLRHLARARVIGCWQVDDVLIDPGPESCSRELFAHVHEPPRAILITHIHLDHAAATGRLIERWPSVPVFVHERGARHLADPSRLLASATRLYGADMRQLWGRVIPVPEANIRALRGTETALGEFRAATTPGHASHHISYLHEPTGWAFTGDVAGVRIPPASYVLMPTPPPDIDLHGWRRSLQTVSSWRPQALAPKHFAAYADVDAHLSAAADALERWESHARALDADAFKAAITLELSASVSTPTASAYAQAAPLDHHYLGLQRLFASQKIDRPTGRKA